MSHPENAPMIALKLHRNRNDADVGSNICRPNRRPGGVRVDSAAGGPHHYLPLRW
jgi:hypothetical protein